MKRMDAIDKIVYKDESFKINGALERGKTKNRT